MRRRRGRAGIVCRVHCAWGGCLPGGRYPCESRRKRVLTGVAFTKSGVVLGGILWSTTRLDFCFSRGRRECIVFVSSVGSFVSIVSSELKKETVFFEQQVSNKHHRLAAVKEHISLPTRRTTVDTRFCAHFRFSEDDYIDCACLIVVVVVVSFEFETTVASVSITLLVLVYVKRGRW